MDNLTKKQRRKNMQNIRSKDTLTEKRIASELRRRRIYFTKNVKSIIGKPDFVFRRKKVVVFVDSDFWHCHPKRFIMPQSNTDYWKLRIECNKNRDKRVTRELRRSGWKVIRVWEYDVKRSFEKIFQKIIGILEADRE